MFDIWILIHWSGISDVTEAYLAAIKGATAESHEVIPQTSIQEKANAFSEHLRADRITAVCKIQDGLQYLSYVVLSTSMPSAWKYCFLCDTPLFVQLVLLVNSYSLEWVWSLILFENLCANICYWSQPRIEDTLSVSGSLQLVWKFRLLDILFSLRIINKLRKRKHEERIKFMVGMDLRACRCIYLKEVWLHSCIQVYLICKCFWIPIPNMVFILLFIIYYFVSLPKTKK